MPYNRYARTNRTNYDSAMSGGWRIRPATAAQVGFVLRLQEEKECESFAREALEQMNGGVVSELIEQLKTATRRPVASPAASPRLDFSSMITLFQQAGEHLKFPKVRLQLEDGTAVVMSVASTRSRNAGCIYVKGEGGYGVAPYYGRINLDGSFGLNGPTGLIPLLQRFSADPAGVAAEYGRLTGNCCFCGRELTDERSTSVGYGPVCAVHYHLPWGEAVTHRTPQVPALAGMTPLGI